LILFPKGLKVNALELQCLNHVVSNVEDWLKATLNEKINRRRDSLIKHWQDRLINNPDVIWSWPGDSDGVCQVIFNQPDYKSRYEQELDNQKAGEFSVLDPTSRRLKDLTRVKVDSISKFNTSKYNAISRGSRDTVLFAKGLEISDLDAQVLQSFIIDIEDWIHGALLGMVNRGRKKMIASYRPAIISDPEVKSIPLTEVALIDMIIKRSDYETAVLNPT
jgi:hypothetical protein